MRTKPWLSTVLLLLFIVLEHLCLFYFFREGVWTTGKNALCLFSSSLLFGIVFLYRFYNVRTEELQTVKKDRLGSWLQVGILLIGLVLIGIEYNAFFLYKDINYAGSDVILLIQVACRRLLAGEFPYRMVYDFGFEQDMTYLPMHWMPMTLSRLAGIDDRWIPYIIWSIAALVICIHSTRVQQPVVKALIPVLLLASNYILFSRNPGIVEGTVELMIAGYYMLLVSGCNTGNGWFQGIMLGCCLLSRYSVVLWLPLYAFVLFTTGRRKQLYIAAGTATAMVLLLYVLPFLTRDPGLFYNGYKYYDKAALFEWTHLNKDQQPIHLFSGTGFAYYFYTRFINYDIPERIKILQRAHIITCLTVTALMCLWYHRHKHKIDHRLFLMGSFKIYLSFFLFLIQVPYVYLMCVGNFVSIVLFCEQARYAIAGERKGTSG